MEENKDAQFYLDDSKKEKPVKKKQAKSAEKKVVKVKRNIRRKKKTPIAPYVIAAGIIVIVVAVLLLQNNAPSNLPQLPQNVVAVVNGQTILREKIDEQYKLIPDVLRAQISKEIILNKTIDETILLQEADKQGIAVTDEEVDDLIDQLMIQSGLSQLDFDKQLRDNNLTIDDLKVVYKDQLRINKLINMSVLSQITVDESDIEAYYEENKDQPFISDVEVRASHILCNTSEEAQMIVDQLNSGADFETLAMENSICPSSVQGGDLGYFTRGMMVPEFEDAAFALQPGQLSGIVQTQFGYHIIKLTERNETMRTLDELHSDIEDTLTAERRDVAIIAYLDDLRREGDIRIYWDVLNSEKPSGITTFSISDDEVCMEDGKPLVMVFTTSTCPHCVWAGPIVDDVLAGRVAAGQIVARHWQVDKGDDLLTDAVETAVPEADMQLYYKYNPGGFVPAFVFGCRYTRVGTGFEGQSGGEELERQEYQAVIDNLI